MLHVDDSSNGSKHELTVGEQFEVVLPENPTTGYRWHLTTPGMTVAELVEDSFSPGSSSVGGGGSHKWVFRAAQPGSQEIELTYGRSWEKKAAKNFTIQIIVKP